MTALLHLNRRQTSVLVAGEGPILKVYQCHDKALLTNVKVFESQSIHGIITDTRDDRDPQQLLLWGGYSIAIVSITILPEAGRNSHQAVCIGIRNALQAPDWVLDAQFRPLFSPVAATAQAEWHAVVVTAHDALLLLRGRAGLDQVQIEELSASSRSILYSAHVSWQSSKQVVVAAGTVFGEILVWSCCLDDPDRPENILRHRYSGHEGSIFGIRMSGVLPCIPFGPDCRLVASCSDDRTIRIWNISLSPAGGALRRDRRTNLTDKVHDTGFALGESNVDSESGDCLAMAWGHTSRIWRVDWPPIQPRSSNSHHPLDLLSFGEDATCQVWHLSRTADVHPPRAPDGGRVRWTLVHAQTMLLHTGKNIWSSTFGITAEQQIILATGGADGRISMSRLGSTTSDSNADCSQLRSWSIEAVYKSFQSTERDEMRYDAIREMGPRESKVKTNGSSVIQGVPLPEMKDLEQDPNEASNPRKKGRVEARLDHFQTVSFIDAKESLLSTAEGLILRSSMEDATPNFSHAPSLPTEPVHSQQRQLQWKKITWLPFSYAHVTTSPANGIIFLGTADGSLYYYSRDLDIVRILVTGYRKFAGLFSHRIVSDVCHLLVTFLDSSVAHYCPIKTPPLQDVSKSYSLELKQMQLPPGFVVTCMRVLDGAGLIIVGSRNGGFAVYDRITVLESSEVERIEASFFIRKLHGPDAITAIVELPEARRSSKVSMTYILTTERNGSYAIHKLSQPEEREGPTLEIQLETVHISYPPFGPMVEGAFFDASDDLVLYGFRSKQFVVWNESKQREMMRVECGGAHRSWAYSPSGTTGASQASFMWTQASKLHLYSQQDMPFHVLQDGGHGREIKAVAVSSFVGNDSAEPVQLLATGAEDTTIRIMAYVDQGEGRRFSTRGAFKKHSTGLLDLKWSECGDYLFSSGGVEEFFVWRIRQIPGFGTGVIRESTCPVTDTLPDLRILSFDVTSIEYSAEDAGFVGKAFVITISYSDSTIRVYRYTSQNKAFEWLFIGVYTNCCLTQAHHYIFNQNAYLFTASTDGHVAFWNLTEALRAKAIGTSDSRLRALATEASREPLAISWQHRARIHQSTVKCMAILRVDHGQAMVATGGDDNALALTRVSFGRTDRTPVAASTIVIPHAHASAITALAPMPSAASAHDKLWSVRLATSSNDQRLKFWSVALDVNKDGVDGLDVRREANEPTAVADVSSMTVMAAGPGAVRVVVCGAGMEIWQTQGGRALRDDDVVSKI